MSAIAQRRSVFSAVLAAYHNDFANLAEGQRHSTQFIQNALKLDEAAAKAALQADPRLTSTDDGAVAIGIAKMVSAHEKCSRSFIDVEIGESAYLVSFDRDVQPQQAISIVSPMGTVAQLCKPGDKLGEDIVSDILILACEPMAPVVEAMIEDAKAVIEEGKHADAAAVAQAGAVKALHAKFQASHGRNATAAEVHQHVLSKNRSPAEMSAMRKHLGEASVTEAEGKFRPYAGGAFITADGQHKYAAGKNADYGTHDHRHYVKHGAGWKHVESDGFDGHDSKEDAINAAKADRDWNDKHMPGAAKTESVDDGYENPEHEHFSNLSKLPKYNGPVNTFTAHGGGDRMHAFMRTGGKVTKDRANVLAGYHASKAKEHDEAWSAAADKASQEHFGRPFGFGDYKVSGVGSDEFSDAHKTVLRQHAQLAGKHRALSAMFGHAARYSKMSESTADVAESYRARIAVHLDNGMAHSAYVHNADNLHQELADVAPTHAAAHALVKSAINGFSVITKAGNRTYTTGTPSHVHAASDTEKHARASGADAMFYHDGKEWQHYKHIGGAFRLQGALKPSAPPETPDNIVRSTTEAKSAQDRAKAASDAAASKEKAKHKRHVREDATALYAYAYGDAALAKLDESKRGDLALAHMMRVFGTAEIKAETGIAKFDTVLAKALAARKLNEAADAFNTLIDDLAFDIYESLHDEIPALAEATIDDNGVCVGRVIEAEDARIQGIARIALMGAGIVAPALAESFESFVAHIKAAVAKKPTA